MHSESINYCIKSSQTDIFIRNFGQNVLLVGMRCGVKAWAPVQALCLANCMTQREQIYTP